ncbi:MAG TPA: hypothetical protein VF850_15160 [Gemmatimonadaceae bacterium]
MRWRDLARHALSSLVAVVLAFLLLKEFIHRGAPLELPTTVESHTWVGENSTRDAVILCIRARRFIPRGATVTLVKPSQAPNYEATIFLTGVGNLPLHRVVAPRLTGDENDLPEYVIALREPLLHARYRKRADFPEGALYERVP